MSEETKTTQHFVLEKDEFDPDDEMLDPEELTGALQEMLKETQAYKRGEIPVRITQFKDDTREVFWSYIDGPAFDMFRILIERKPKEKGFVASMPELPGCMAEGATHEEAIANLRTAVTQWFDAASREGREFPKPGATQAAA